MSVVDCPWQILSGPEGVTTGVTGKGVMLTDTALLAADVPQLFCAVTVLVLAAVTDLVVPVPPPDHA